MTKKQRIIVIILAIGDVVLCLLLTFAIGYSTLFASPHAPGESTSPLPEPARTLLPTLPPTWTPPPSPTVYVRPTATPRSPTADETTLLNQVEEEIQILRGLGLMRPVPRYVLTQTQLRQRADEWFGGEGLEESAHRLTILLSALDLVEPDVDLIDHWETMLSRQIAGFYVSETEEIYIISNTDVGDPMGRLTFAHETVHALQDQYYGLDRLGFEETEGPYDYSDRNEALRALIEGDATLAQYQYAEQTISIEDFFTLYNEIIRTSRLSESTQPEIVAELFSFPYAQGLQFAAALHEHGGWEAIDRAYASPPVSTEQILHPERYLEGDAPLPVSLPSLGSLLGDRWHPIYHSSAGEFMLRLYLMRQLPQDEAAVAAEGWGGDAFVAYHNDETGETVVALNVVWDTAGDASEFVAAYADHAAARLLQPAEDETQQGSCWQGIDAACILRQDQGTLLVLGPDLSLVQEIMLALSAPE